MWQHVRLPEQICPSDTLACAGTLSNQQTKTKFPFSHIFKARFAYMNNNVRNDENDANSTCFEGASFRTVFINFITICLSAS